MILRFAVTALVVLCSNIAFGQFTDLTKRIPDGANVIMLLNVEQLHKSPLGISNDWQGKHAKSVEAGLAGIPVEATKMVKAAKLDLTNFEPEWEVGFVDLKTEPSILEVAKRYGGGVDHIEGRDIAVLPSDTYIVKFGPRYGGYGLPAKRQDVANWISRIDNNSLNGLSSYLKEAKSFADDGSPIIMAMNLQWVVPQEFIKERLKTADFMNGSTVDLEALSVALASIRGVSLGVTVTDKITGAIKVDFDKDISLIGDLAKPMLLEILANNGVMIREIRNWNVSVTGTRIQLTGPLEASGLQRILSLLDRPPTMTVSPVANQTNQEATDQMKVLASQNYFRTVVSLLDDLRSDKRNRQTMGQIGVWFEKYARQIDRLPILNVDDDLLSYGKFVSESLRQGHAEVTNAAASSRIRQQQVPEQYNYRGTGGVVGVNRSGAYGWYNYTATRDNQRKGQIQAGVRTQETIRGSMSANLILQHIDDATADIRRHMTKKMNAEF